MTTKDGVTTSATKGLVLHAHARYYDVLAWLLSRGRERALRERLVDLARIELGEAVLRVVESAPVGVRDLQFALATAPGRT